MNALLNGYALTAAMANAIAVSYTDAGGFHYVSASVPGVANSFISKVASAKQQIRNGTNNPILTPDLMFMTPARHEYIIALSDASARPYFQPQKVSREQLAHGETGTSVAALPVFVDNLIPAPSVGVDQVVVLDSEEVYAWREDAPRFAVLPYSQVGAPYMSVTVRAYTYAAVLPRYYTAVAAISGSGFTSPIL